MIVKYTSVLNLFISIIFIVLTNNYNKCSVNCAHYSPNHCNHTVDRIDAITNFTNGSLFVSSGSYYWILNGNERPTENNSKSLTDLSPNITRVEAVFNVRMRADPKQSECSTVSEHIIFYAQDINDQLIIISYENGKWGNATSDVNDIDIFSAAKSVNWNESIDAITAFDNFVIIFQGDTYTSVKCDGGVWRDIKQFTIESSFTPIDSPIDAANCLDISNSLDYILYLFKGEDYYTCSIFGNDPCNGPHSIVDHFFKYDRCDSATNGKTSNFNNSIIMIIVILLIVLLGVLVYLIVKRSRQITFWVNRQRSHKNGKQANVQLTYEALNGGQQDVQSKESEKKSHTKNGFETISEEQSSTPFIDSDVQDNNK